MAVPNKSLITVNFNELKFNLYEILGLTNDASESKIKKSFKKLVLELHPDKNSDSNEEIYNHVIIANQVLTNPSLRKDYNNFLDAQSNKSSHIDLKNDFDSTSKDIEKYFPVKAEATKTFKSKFEELNMKHIGAANIDAGANIMNQYEKLKKTRDTHISIPQERIANTKDFNSKFDSRKENNTFDNQIIAIPQGSHNLGTYQSADGLTGIGDYSKLYTEDSVSTGAYTSLDMAFKIQRVDADFKEKTLKERMEEYKNQTSLFASRTK